MDYKPDMILLRTIWRLKKKSCSDFDSVKKSPDGDIYLEEDDAATILFELLNNTNEDWAEFEKMLGSINYEYLDNQVQPFFQKDRWTGELDENYSASDENAISVYECPYLAFKYHLIPLFKEWLESKEIESSKFEKNKLDDIKKSTIDKLISPETLIINFNYTNTVEKLYGEKLNENNVLHIHGTIDNDDIVLGHLKEGKVFDNKYFSASEYQKKIYDLLIKNTEKGQDVLKIFIANHQFEKVDKVYIIGHSVSEVDKGYFTKLAGSTSDVTLFLDKYQYEHAGKNKNKLINRIENVWNDNRNGNNKEIQIKCIDLEK